MYGTRSHPPTSPRARRFRQIAVWLLIGGLLSMIGRSPVAASPSPASTQPVPAAPVIVDRTIDVIDVSGLIDGVVAEYILGAIDQAATDGAEALVIELDSSGSVLRQSELDALEAKIRNDKRVPIAVWVGPIGARAKGGAVRLLRAADIVGMAPITSVGDSTRAVDGDEPLFGLVMNQKDALKTGVAQLDAAVLKIFVAQLDGRTIDGRTITTARPVLVDGKPKVEKGLPVRDIVAQPRFSKMALLPRLLHTVSNPSIAYLLLIIGLALMLFEFFTGGVGVAASVGIGCAALAAFGLGTLPVRGVALALLVFAMLGFAIDIQAGTPRFWTAVAVAAFLAGSLLLYRNGIKVPWYWIAVLGLMLFIFMVNGMPSMVRTRFATPTIGRASLIGEIGQAIEAVNPDGSILLHGAPWRARTNRATPIRAGEQVRVAAIDGLLLEVEPLEGAAKDAGH